MTAVVVVSGLDDESLAIEAVHNGAQDYLLKGQFDDQSLVRSLRYAVERNRSQRRLAAQHAVTRILSESDDARRRGPAGRSRRWGRSSTGRSATSGWSTARPRCSAASRPGTRRGSPPPSSRRRAAGRRSRPGRACPAGSGPRASRSGSPTSPRRQLPPRLGRDPVGPARGLRLPDPARRRRPGCHRVLQPRDPPARRRIARDDVERRRPDRPVRRAEAVGVRAGRAARLGALFAELGSALIGGGPMPAVLQRCAEGLVQLPRRGLRLRLDGRRAGGPAEAPGDGGQARGRGRAGRPGAPGRRRGRPDRAGEAAVSHQRDGRRPAGPRPRLGGRRGAALVRRATR